MKIMIYDGKCVCTKSSGDNGKESLSIIYFNFLCFLILFLCSSYMSMLRWVAVQQPAVLCSFLSCT